MGIAVDGHPVARPTLIREFPPLLDRSDHRCRRCGSQFANVQVGARFQDARFLDEVERSWITLELIGHVDKLIEIDVESWTGLIRADFSMADDMISVAGVAHRLQISSINRALASYNALDQSVSARPSCSIPIVYKSGLRSGFNRRQVGETIRPACQA